MSDVTLNDLRAEQVRLNEALREMDAAWPSKWHPFKRREARRNFFELADAFDATQQQIVDLHRRLEVLERIEA